MDRTQLIDELQRTVGSDNIVDNPDDLLQYGADWTTVVPMPPTVAVLARTSEQVESALKLAAHYGLPVVVRGAGTGLAGGARPHQDGGMVIATSHMTDIYDIDLPNRQALVQTGLINYDLSQRLAPDGYFYAPDPASWQMCTIGGNIANNSGGPRCLKYGVTSNHILAIELVLHDGRTIWTSDGLQDAAGYDLTGIVVGSEGTFGVATRALVRITRLPEDKRVVLALFPTMVQASETVSAVIAAGYLPTALEVMDRTTIQAVNITHGFDLPDTADAALIIEVDGVVEALDGLLDAIVVICHTHGAIQVQPARTPEEQERVWAARKSAFTAFGCFAPAYYLVDTAVPRTRLPYMMEQVERMSKQYDMPIANVFHAGDGNLHPLVLYDPHNADQVERAHAISAEVLRLSIEQGGAVTGEHGVGAEKANFLAQMFNEDELQAMAALYAVFNPEDRLNPGKIFPDNILPLERAAQRHKRIASSYGINGLRNLAEALVAAVGRDHLLCDEATTPYVIHGHTPRLVVFPGDEAQVAAVMRACHHAGAVVVLWGGGTQQSSGTLNAAPDVVIVLRRLSGIQHYDPDDLVIRVGAGTTLDELQRIVAEHGQMFPLEVASPEQATIGGLVATAAEGPRRLRYGTLRDLMVGLTVIEVDGTRIRCGGQVVKNVSGYDMVKLFHGSHGTLGIITSVTVRTLPQPPLTTTILATFASREQALAMARDLAATQLTPTAIEYLDQGALRALGQDDAHGLAMRVEDVAAACTRHVHDIRALAVQHHTISIHNLTGDSAFWQQLAQLAATHDLSEDEMVLRLVVNPTDLNEALEHLTTQAHEHGTVAAINARTQIGIVYARLRIRAEALNTLQHTLTQRWGHSHILACGFPDKAGIAVWGKPPISVDLMQAIKQQFDPAHTLNPGRLPV